MLASLSPLVLLALVLPAAFASPIGAAQLVPSVVVPIPAAASPVLEALQNVLGAHPATSTPLYKHLRRPSYGPIDPVVKFFHATESDEKSFLSLAAKQKGMKMKRATTSCLDSTTNDTTINLLFWYGATTVYLCPNAVIPLSNAIYFTRVGQVLQTLGLPTGSTRAILRITNPNITCAIWANQAYTSNIQVLNIQIDGNRANLGWVSNGLALVEMGGNGHGQIIDRSAVFEPRGWSAVHAIEGDQNTCTGFVATNNQVGPAGHAPSGAAQFKRDSTGTYAPGQWADGLSIACANSTIRGNTITDATDGAIVIFGAPGSVVSSNTILANDRQLLGGINMVDFWPWAGSFVNVSVKSNTIISNASMIKVGIAVGVLSWQTFNETYGRNFGGSVQNNLFKSGSTGYFGYGLSVGGHNGSTVTGNSFSRANFGGVPTAACVMTMPAPGPLIQNPYTTPFSTFQKTLVPTVFNFLICNGPGQITTKGLTLQG